MKKLKMASLFSGVGGIDHGFEKTGLFETVYANEFDEKAQETYKLNNPNVFLDERDIRDVETDDIPDIDVVLSGFPCQAFSVAGYRKGFEDKQNGDLFFETLRVVVAKQPRIVFLENVKNLVGHDKGKTFRIICDALKENGYYIKYQVLNAKEFGNIPQNRERIYVIAFKYFEDYVYFNFPLPVELTTTLSDVIDFNEKVDDKFYYTRNSFKHYDELEKEMTDSDSVYQWRRKYIRKNKSGVVPTLTANMGTGGHNVPLIIAKDGFRKLTPRETFNVQGFPSNFKLPEQANGHLYKQAGNSVVIPVIERIANEIVTAIKLNKNEPIQEEINV